MRKVFLIFSVMSLGFIFGQEMKEIKLTEKNSWLKAGITAGIPVGDVSNFSSVSLGVDLRGQYMANPHLGVGIATGYNHFIGKNEADDFGMVPLGLFARYYFHESGWFIGSDLGYGFLTNIDNNYGGLYVNPHLGYNTEDWNFYGYFQNTFSENSVNVQSVGVGITYNISFK